MYELDLGAIVFGVTAVEYTTTVLPTDPFITLDALGDSYHLTVDRSDPESFIEGLYTIEVVVTVLDETGLETSTHTIKLRLSVIDTTKPPQKPNESKTEATEAWTPPTEEETDSWRPPQVLPPDVLEANDKVP